MAFQKGILVFSSAGNEATDSWVRIIAPSDGENVIGVAAVSVDGTRASFSSIGPAYGGAVKPNVAARGALTFLIKSNGSPGNSSGTSFASPVLAGMGACLMQSNPLATVEQLKLAIEQSSSQFLTPDSLIGYGIPDFEKADQILKVNHAERQKQISSWAVSPNPFNDYLLIRNLNSEINENCQVSIYNFQGMCISQTNFKSSENYLLKNLAHLPEGLLILNIRAGKKSEQIKLLKLNR
jgi:subtilisin family serine protease